MYDVYRRYSNGRETINHGLTYQEAISLFESLVRDCKRYDIIRVKLGSQTVKEWLCLEEHINVAS